MDTPSTNQAFTYNSAGQLTNDGTNSYSYDGAGNQVTAGSSSYQYNALGQMTSSTLSGTSSSYAYNSDGLRVTSTTGSAVTPTVWDSASGSPVPVLNGATAFVNAGTTPLEQINGSTSNQLLTDALGSVRDVANGTGSVVGSSTYNPFGTVASTTGTTSALGYTGAITDSTSLIYDQGRYYNPTVGQFTSSDSVIPNAAGTPGYNLYGYTAENPVTRTDPTGHQDLAEEDSAAAVSSTLNQAEIPNYQAATQAAEGLTLEESVLIKTQEIFTSPAVDTLRAAYESGEPAVIEEGGYTIRYEPSLPASGISGFGENGFTLGPEAFSSEEEFAKTFLHEMYRLETSLVPEAGASGELVKLETDSAAGYASEYYGLLIAGE